MKNRRIVAVLLSTLLIPRPLPAWGLDVHRFVTAGAIDLLPTNLRPFYEKHRSFIVEHSVDPDLWRNVGFTEEPPRHYLDLDSYGLYPFRELPRDRQAAIQKFGRDKIEQEGQLPWRVDEVYGKLAQAVQQQKVGSHPYSLDDIKFFSAVISHYVSDGHVPFHAAKNYDGQLTNQQGIHSRLETEAVLRYQARLTIRPAPLVPVSNVIDFIFDALLKSFTLVDPILKADREAVRGRQEYDDSYFDQFFEQVRPILERRLNDSMTAVASMIVSAWEKGGKPDLPLEVKRAPKKVKRERP
jgi:hypothetical protein